MSLLWRLRSFIQSRRAASIVLSQGDGSAPPSSSFFTSPDDLSRPSLTLLRTPTRPVEAAGLQSSPGPGPGSGPVNLFVEEPQHTTTSSLSHLQLTATPPENVPVVSSPTSVADTNVGAHRIVEVGDDGDHDEVGTPLSSSANVSLSVPRRRVSSHATHVSHVSTVNQIDSVESHPVNPTFQSTQPLQSTDNVQNVQNETNAPNSQTPQTSQNLLATRADEIDQERQTFRRRFQLCCGIRVPNLIFPILAILLVVTVVITALQWRQDFVDGNPSWTEERCFIETLETEKMGQPPPNFRLKATVSKIQDFDDSDVRLPTTAYYGENELYSLTEEEANDAKAKFKPKSNSKCWVKREKQNTVRISLMEIQANLSLGTWISTVLTVAVSIYLMVVLMGSVFGRIPTTIDEQQSTLRRVAQLAQNGGARRGTPACLTSAQARFVCNVFARDWRPQPHGGGGFGEGIDRDCGSGRGHTGGGGVHGNGVAIGDAADERVVEGACVDHIRRRRRKKRDPCPPVDWVCAVCLDGPDGQSQAVVRMVELPCSHRFHRGCIRRWLRRGKPTCPLCQWDARRLFDPSGLPSIHIVDTAVGDTSNRAPNTLPSSTGLTTNHRGDENNTDRIVNNDGVNTENNDSNDNRDQIRSLSILLDESDCERYIEGIATWHQLGDEDSVSSTRTVIPPPPSFTDPA